MTPFRTCSVLFVFVKRCEISIYLWSSAQRDEALAAADRLLALLPLGQRPKSSAVPSFVLWCLSFLCPDRQVATSEEPCTPFLPLSLTPWHNYFPSPFILLSLHLPEALQLNPSASTSPLCFKHGLLWRNDLRPGWTSRPQEQPQSLWPQRTVPSGSDIGQGALCCGQTGSSFEHRATGCCQDDWQDKTWCYGNKPPLTGSEVKNNEYTPWKSCTLQSVLFKKRNDADILSFHHHYTLFSGVWGWCSIPMWFASTRSSTRPQPSTWWWSWLRGVISTTTSFATREV